MARENVLQVAEKKDRYKVCYMAGDDSGFDMMEGALLVLESLNLPIDWACSRCRSSSSTR